MLDSTMRPIKDRLLAPVVAGPLGRVHPTVVSSAALAASLGAAVAAWQRLAPLAVALWLAGRILDGLDGPIARASGRQSDVGGLLDFVFDTIGYAAVPLGIAFGVDDRTTWVATAIVVATFYVNAVSLGHVAALLEQRGRGASARREPTSVTMPRGLVEGTETIVLFTLALALPDHAWWIWTVMAVAVIVTALERIRWAATQLGTKEPSA
jgi:phosphatidylglycerophosphate synthase